MLCDEFVFLDHVQFSKPSYTHRALFPLPNSQVSYLSVPTSSTANKSKISDVVSSDIAWQINHRNKLNEWLKDYTFYDDLDFLWALYVDKHIKTLAQFNEQVIKLVAERLEIDCFVVNSTSLGLASRGTQLIADIVNNRKAESYITGTGFLKYYETGKWPGDIKLQVIDFRLLMDGSMLSPYSIVENIARLGLTKTRKEFVQICSSQQEKLNS